MGISQEGQTPAWISHEWTSGQFADAHYYVDAIMKLSGTTLTVTLTDNSQWPGMAGTYRHVYEVLQADDSNLRLRIISKEET